MDYEERLKISYFEKIKNLNFEHGISLVKHMDSGEIFVRKILTVYNRSIYDFLKFNPIKGIPKVHHVYEENNNLTLIEDYIEGVDLNSFINLKTTINREQLLSYLLQISTTLDKLHNLKMPIIHRDIKPSNIIIDKNGNAILIDFNAGKFYDPNDTKSSDTTLLGTHGFAAPEQYGFGASTPKTDIYGFGILIKNLIPLLPSETYKNDLIEISDLCTKINPDDRYFSMKDVIKDLKKAVSKKTPDTTKFAYKFSTTTVGRFLKKYALPGFRSGNILHALIAIPFYIFAILFVAIVTTEDPNPLMTPLYKIIFGLMEASTVCCTCNYLDIHKFFPLCKKRNIFLRAIGVILLNCTAYALLFILLVIIVQFID